jgi:hypothetical protein
MAALVWSTAVKIMLTFGSATLLLLSVVVLYLKARQMGEDPLELYRPRVLVVHVPPEDELEIFYRLRVFLSA